MYDVNSKCADDFISHEEILDTLAYADENKENAEAIQVAAEDAANAYVIWQKTHIGADINTDVLIEFLRAAGVKRAVLRSPAYKMVADTQIAVARNINALYGGLEDD